MSWPPFIERLGTIRRWKELVSAAHHFMLGVFVSPIQSQPCVQGAVFTDFVLCHCIKISASTHTHTDTQSALLLGNGWCERGVGGSQEKANNCENKNPSTVFSLGAGVSGTGSSGKARGGLLAAWGGDGGGGGGLGGVVLEGGMENFSGD